MRWKKPGPSDSRQLSIDWSVPADHPTSVDANAPPVPPASPAPVNLPSTADDRQGACVTGAAGQKAGEVTAAAHSAGPVQYLPWDFLTTFPPVLEDALEAGIITEDDAEPENLAALHREQAAELLGVLESIDTIHDARRRGVDPATGKPPRGHAHKLDLPPKLDKEIHRLQRWWQTLLDPYEAAFGSDAADAFAKALRARHAGIEVIAAAPMDSENPPRRSTGVPILPTPKPLAHAVAAGSFGHDENGAVHPGDEEVDDITRNHAELLIDLLETLRGAERTATSESRQKITAEVDAAVQKYADDFGADAAGQLLAYARRVALLNDSNPIGTAGGWRR